MPLISLHVTFSNPARLPQERAIGRSRDVPSRKAMDAGRRDDEASTGTASTAGDPVQPVGPTMGSLAGLIVPQVVTSTVFAMLIIMIPAFISRPSDWYFGVVGWDFLSRFLGPGYRDNAPGLMGVVAGLVVALAALSWSSRKRPEDPRYLRAWLVGVLDDARREMITVALMVVLAMFAGAFTVLYWLGVAAAQTAGRDVMSESAVGIALTCVACVTFMLPCLLRNSGSGALSGYVGVVRELLAFAQWRYERGDRLALRGGERTAGSARTGARSQKRLLTAIFLIVALLDAACIGIYACWRGADPVAVVVVGAVVGVVLGGEACALALIVAHVVPDVVVGAPGSRVVAIFTTFIWWAVYILTALLSVVAVLVAGRAKEGYWPDLLFVLLLVIATLPPIAHLLLGWPAPFLRDLVERRIRVVQERRVGTYRNYFSADPGRDADKRAVMDVLVPVDAVLVAQGSPSRWRRLVGMRAWTHRAELRYPSASVTGRNAREYFATEFHLDGNG